MKGRLFAVEGGTGSGKNTLLDCIAVNGYYVMRGGPSQNHIENKLLNKKSQEILGDAKINMMLMLESPVLSKDVIQRYIKIVQSQQEAAIKRKKKGLTVFLNRSVLSLIVHIRLVCEKFKENEVLTNNVKTILEDVKKNYFQVLDAIFLFETPVHGVTKEGIAGKHIEESKYITELVQIAHTSYGIPILRLNANTMSVTEELDAVEQFIASLVLQ